jgi:hypothetical protein
MILRPQLAILETMWMTGTDEQYELVKRLSAIFMPYASARLAEVEKRQGRFVHYTSAESALKIITSKSMWMRNTWCMNDYTEVEHGIRTLREHAKTKELVDAFRSLPEVGEQALNLYNAWENDTKFGTFITSISEHADSEDAHGRLSMWRAVAGSGPRVALVLRLPFTPASGELGKLILSPVAYFNNEQLAAELTKVIVNVQQQRDFLLSAERQAVVANIFHMLVMAVVCLKHEGFHEEREWRVLYWPKRNASSVMKTSVEIIGGVPQVIHKIPLSGGPPPELARLSIPGLLDRVIIGASAYPWAMYEAFTAALTEAGVPNAGERVLISGIPIRST